MHLRRTQIDGLYHFLTEMMSHCLTALDLHLCDFCSSESAPDFTLFSDEETDK